MNLLIVDDDYQIRNGMRYGIEWESVGITQVETSANGIEALQLIEKNSPDIVVADIQMPGMNGLDMVKKIREINDKIRVIFISAYSEFNYCRQALLLGANDYVLKPIQMDEFIEVIRKNVEALNQEKMQEMHYKKAIMEQKLQKIYEGRGDADEDEFRNLLENIYPFLKSDYIITVVLKARDSAMENVLSLKKDMLEKLSAQMDGKLAVAAEINDELICIGTGNNSALMTVYQQNMIKQQLMEWNRIYEGKYGAIVGGISHSHIFGELRKGYIQALEALGQQFYKSEEVISIYTFRKSDSEMRKTIEWDMRLTLENESDNEEEIGKLLEKAALSGMQPEEFKACLAECMKNICGKHGWIFEKEVLENELQKCRCGDACLRKTAEYMKIYAAPACDKTNEHTYSRTIRLATEYIKKHYEEPITVGDVAGVVEKTPNYLSSIFKKETGVSFSKYLNELRLQKACVLLKHTNKQVREISEAVGYTDYIYFSQLFRKYYGCSATDMRSKENKGGL